jgi:O-acetyl-ADP-ribose deacetylase (regulator of RNase III)
MLKYVIGDATDPIKKPAIIAHVCNNIGLMASGFVVPLCAKNPKIKEAYEAWYKNTKAGTSAPPLELGEVQLLDYEEDVLVANMIAQHETIRTNPIPIRYPALTTCLKTVYKYAAAFGYTVHMPRIGAVRSKGSWGVIEKIIEDVIKEYPVETYVYTLENEKDKWPGTNYDNSIRA